ncbi:hypothetical protein JCGZ_23579 [Jatropha curcas]|uniref:Bulb-type lectin domain-containing protein n=2 Tax=Jatropha curcas TaxID=180498 RepID=A0A067JII4_JATCU|nr:hypothetical protein JCGZ_23579 [Jatropha curcas]
MAEKNISGGNFTVTLLDSGNLVVRQVNSDGFTGSVIWQSFDYPHNIFLPGMKLGMNLKTGKNWTLTSWLSEKNPSPGAFRLGLDPNGANQLIIWRRDSRYWSSGVWVNGSFELAPQLTKRNDIYDFRFFENEDEKYFSYSVKNKSVLSRWSFDTIGEIEVFTLDKRGDYSTWIFESVGPCQNGFNSSAVCLTEKPNKCRNDLDVFVPKRAYVENDERFFYYDSDLSLGVSDCHAKCWGNCTCIAYQSSSRDGTGCQYWSKGSKFTPDDNADFVYLLSHQGK